MYSSKKIKIVLDQLVVQLGVVCFWTWNFARLYRSSDTTLLPEA